MTTITNFRMRSDSCPEPLERQKTSPLKSDFLKKFYFIINIDTVFSRKLVQFILDTNKYFQYEIV